MLLGPLTLHDLDAGSFREHTSECWPAARPLLPAATAAASCPFSRPLPPAPHLTGPSLARLHRAGWWEALTAPAQRVGLMGQGFQRRLDEGGHVLPLAAPSPQLLVG